MTNRIMQAVYDAMEHAICAGDFIETECMSLGTNAIYICIDGKNYELKIKEYKL